VGTKKLESAGISLFCEGMAMMLAAGIQLDEAASMLADDIGDEALQKTSQAVYHYLIKGHHLADAMEKTKAFPTYALDMVCVGEASGRLEEALRALSAYYSEEDRIFAKIQSAVVYPALLLCVMSIILAFTVMVILPVFEDVYASMASSLLESSYGFEGASIVVGWVSLGVTLVCALVAVGMAIACRSQSGRDAVMRLLGKLPFTHSAMEQLTVSRFLSVLAAYTASGADADTAMSEALSILEHPALKRRAETAYELMVDPQNPRTLTQALTEAQMFEQIYVRMLEIGMHSGSLDESLDRMAMDFYDDALLQIDAAIDLIEPTLAILLTLSVGITLISVMLPLIGIMGSIG
jgi:type IV pilus assembly protein PilC